MGEGDLVVGRVSLASQKGGRDQGPLVGINGEWARLALEKGPFTKVTVERSSGEVTETILGPREHMVVCGADMHVSTEGAYANGTTMISLKRKRATQRRRLDGS